MDTAIPTDNCWSIEHESAVVPHSWQDLSRNVLAEVTCYLLIIQIYTFVICFSATFNC